jgi:transcription antitermination factor NusG
MTTMKTTHTEGQGRSDIASHAWYALRTRQRYEKCVAAHLRAKGYEEYLPLHTSRRRWSDRTVTLQTPLFPGYTFCKFDVHYRLPVLVVPGVLYIVGLGAAPIPVSETELHSIQRLIASGLHCATWPFTEIGRSVLIERGPLAGVKGTIIRKRSNCRLIVSMALLQRSVAVEIDADCMKPLAAVSTEK